MERAEGSTSHPGRTPGQARRVLDLSGRISLPIGAAVVQHLDLLITNNSGPAHFAYAFGTPSVTLFLATDPGRWGPLEDAVQHCILVNPSRDDVTVAAHRLLG